jgi:hypothetical protein
MKMELVEDNLESYFRTKKGEIGLSGFTLLGFEGQLVIVIDQAGDLIIEKNHSRH